MIDFLYVLWVVLLISGAVCIVTDVVISMILTKTIKVLSAIGEAINNQKKNRE